METKIMRILEDICGAGPGELEPGMDLFGLGLMDSFAVVQLLVALEEACGVTLDIEALTREDIATPEKIIRRVEGLL